MSNPRTARPSPARPRRAPARAAGLRRRLAASRRRPPGGLAERLRDLARRSPWWLLSLLVHGIVVLILMHWTVIVRYREEVVAVVQVGIRPAEPEPKPIDITEHVSPEPPAIEPPLAKDQFSEVVDNAALSELDKEGRTPIFAVESAPFAARSPGGREAVVKGGGGATGASENAVELGLAWLARNQLSTGGWRAGHEGARWADPGLSGLATMAFLGAGYTHQKGKYAKVVQRALGYLKGTQDTEGCMAVTEGDKRGGGYMYCHAMATLALVEAYGMTEDPLLLESAQRSIDFICRTQNPLGGWRYYGNSPDADSSVSGWMVMALRSASLVGLDVPPKAFDGARRFFDSVTDKEGGKTNYLRGVPMGMALHAVGLLCHQYLGMAADDPYIDRAGAVINASPPKWTEKEIGLPLPLDKMALLTGTNNYYYWYYANLALFQRRGPAWDKWHPQVRELLIKIQERDGDRAGSWPPLTYGGSTGGRVYTTALGVLCLEVYYRYSPIYKNPVDEVLAAYGDALSAYNHFARLPDAEKPLASDARQAAITKLHHFLSISESRIEQKDPRRTAQQRDQAALMLVRLHRAAGELKEAIALLRTFPDRFPAALDGIELVKALADLHRALAQQFADAGDAPNAQKARAIAIELYYPIVSKWPGKYPDLELWMANDLFEREDWQKALELYKARLTKVDFKRLDPKSEEGRLVAAVLDRIVTCAGKLRLYKTASLYLEQLEKLVGPSLPMMRRRAELCRLRNDPAAARRIYDAILPRLPEYSKEWWETRYDQLFTAYLEGRGDDVAKVILKLQISHPELGGQDLQPRFLDLLGRAQNGKPQARVLPAP